MKIKIELLKFIEQTVPFEKKDKIKCILNQENDINFKEKSLSRKIRQLIPKLKIKNIKLEDLSYLQNLIFDLKQERDQLKHFDSLDELIVFYFKNIYDIDFIVDTCLKNIDLDLAVRDEFEAFKCTHRMSKSKSLAKEIRVLTPLLSSKKLSDSLKKDLSSYLISLKPVKISFKDKILKIIN